MATGCEGSIPGPSADGAVGVGRAVTLESPAAEGCAGTVGGGTVRGGTATFVEHGQLQRYAQQ